MSNVPRYLMDKSGFYFNPECPELGLTFNGPITINEIKQIRIPVRIFRGGELVVPGGPLPADVEADTLVLS